MKDILQALEVPPKRIILNTTAVHESRTLYTLNSIAYGVCPYRVQHHEEVFKEIRDAGYRRRDVWRNDSKPIRIPFVEGGDAAYYFDDFDGAAMRRTVQAGLARHVEQRRAPLAVAQAHRFTWSHCADAYVARYLALLDAGGEAADRHAAA